MCDDDCSISIVDTPLSPKREIRVEVDSPTRTDDTNGHGLGELVKELDISIGLISCQAIFLQPTTTNLVELFTITNQATQIQSNIKMSDYKPTGKQESIV